jgi:hypothetical protein
LQKVATSGVFHMRRLYRNETIHRVTAAGRCTKQ